MSQLDQLKTFRQVDNELMNSSSNELPNEDDQSEIFLSNNSSDNSTQSEPQAQSNVEFPSCSELQSRLETRLRQFNVDMDKKRQLLNEFCIDTWDEVVSMLQSGKNSIHLVASKANCSDPESFLTIINQTLPATFSLAIKAPDAAVRRGCCSKQAMIRKGFLDEINQIISDAALEFQISWNERIDFDNLIRAHIAEDQRFGTSLEPDIPRDAVLPPLLGITDARQAQDLRFFIQRLIDNDFIGSETLLDIGSCVKNPQAYMGELVNDIIDHQEKLNRNIVEYLRKIQGEFASIGEALHEEITALEAKEIATSIAKERAILSLGVAAIAVGVLGGVLAGLVAANAAAVTGGTSLFLLPEAVSVGFALGGAVLSIEWFIERHYEGELNSIARRLNNVEDRIGVYRTIHERAQSIGFFGVNDLIDLNAELNRRIEERVDEILSLPQEQWVAAFTRFEEVEIIEISDQAAESITRRNQDFIDEMNRVIEEVLAEAETASRQIPQRGRGQPGFGGSAVESFPALPIALESVDCIGEQCESFPRLRYRVRVIQPGRSLNNYEYSPKMLQRSAKLLEDVPVQAYGFGQYQPMFSHLPTDLESMQPSGFALNRVGMLREPAYENHSEFGEGLFATLVMDESAEGWAKAILDEATTPSGNGTGVSIFADIDGDYGYDDLTDEMYVKVNSIKNFRSVDLASQPAAGGAIVAAMEGAGWEQREHLEQLKEEIQNLTIEEIIEARLGYHRY